jgi:hypothetical protein
MGIARFDALLERVARQTTRRSALATLLGGALLLNAPDASEATKEAERRKQPRTTGLKPIAILVDNTAGAGPVNVLHKDMSITECCRFINSVMVPPGERLRFVSPTPLMSLEFIRYWFDIFNPIIGLPFISAAVGGMAPGNPFLRVPWPNWCCGHPGETVLDSERLDVGEAFTIIMDGKIFTLRRNRDTNYKEYTLTLPANL